MEGPSFDGEHALRALGFMRYYEAWSGHTCHFNSTSLVSAMSSGEQSRRPGASLVMLYQRIPSTSSELILRQPPAEADRQCSAGSTELGCDRHHQNNRSTRVKPPKSKFYPAGRPEGALPPLRYPNDGPAIDLQPLDIFEKMVGLRTFHDSDHELSRVAAHIVTRYGAKKGAKVVHCALSAQPELSGFACVQALVKAARHRLSSATTTP
jgi:hypothetical protein